MDWKENMIFQSVKSSNFNYTSTNFIDMKLYFAYSKIGPLMTTSNQLGPVDCGSFGETKGLAQKKSFSESIERRSLVDIEQNKNKSKVSAFNLLKNSIELIPKMVTVYNDVDIIVDTTGTAAHRNSGECLLNSLTELLEKNATYLFWYGKSGYRLDQNNISRFKIYHVIKQQGFEIEGFVNLDFYPVIVVYIRISNTFSNMDINNVFGVGSSVSLDKAISKALKEGLFLMSMHMESHLRKDNSSYSEGSYENTLIETLKNKEIFNNLNEMEFLKEKFIKFENKDLNIKEEIEYILTSLPKWIENIWVVVMPQKLNKNLIITKVYSDNLINCVPFKENINLDLEINKYTINLDENELNKKFDCPIL